jgi:hypothetical protein
MNRSVCRFNCSIHLVRDGHNVGKQRAAVQILNVFRQRRKNGDLQETRRLDRHGGRVARGDKIGFDQAEVVGYTIIVLSFLLVFFGIRRTATTLAPTRSRHQSPLSYPATFFACARNFAHLFLAALPILALAAADMTRFFTLVTSRSAECPKALAAARTPLNWRCSLPNCLSSFRSSRLIAVRMSMDPPHEIYLNRR